MLSISACWRSWSRASSCDEPALCQWWDGTSLPHWAARELLPLGCRAAHGLIFCFPLFCSADISQGPKTAGWKTHPSFWPGSWTDMCTCLVLSMWVATPSPWSNPHTWASAHLGAGERRTLGSLVACFTYHSWRSHPKESRAAGWRWAIQLFLFLSLVALLRPAMNYLGYHTPDESKQQVCCRLSVFRGVI